MARLPECFYKILFGVLLYSLFFSGSSFAETDVERRLRILEERFESQSKKTEWLDRFSFNGDFRLRHEHQGRDPQNASNKTDRNRQRIRLRLGGAFHLYRDLDIGIRFATGGTDPLSANQTLENTAETKGIELDRVFAEFRTGLLKLTGGKFATPFMGSELIWDGDLSPEGAVEQISHSYGKTSLKLILGQIVIDEISGLSDDPYLLAYQGVVSQKLSLGTVTLGLGYFQYYNLAGNTIDNNPSNSASTNTLDGTTHAFDISTMDIICEFAWNTAVPITFFGEYANNVEDDPSLDEAWQLGLKINKKAKTTLDWQVRYLYRLVQQDAVFANWADSDLHNGGTNYKGHEMGIDIGLRKGIIFKFTHFISKEERGPKDNLEKSQFDLNFLF